MESRLLYLSSAMILSKMLNPEDEHDLSEIFRRRNRSESSDVGVGVDSDERSKSEMGGRKKCSAFEAGIRLV